jgi:multisubunit Na+/H+ antiporter MnhE subunit
MPDQTKLRRVTSILLLWGAFLGIYLIYAGSLSAAELAAGSAVAAFVAFLFLRLRKCFRSTYRFRCSWLPSLLRIFPAVFTESWQLYVCLAKRTVGKEVHGRFLEHRYVVDPADPHSSARFAFMTFGVCVTPNSYLVRVDRSKGNATVRQLAGDKMSVIDRKFLELE